MDATEIDSKKGPSERVGFPALAVRWVRPGSWFAAIAIAVGAFAGGAAAATLDAGVATDALAWWIYVIAIVVSGGLGVFAQYRVARTPKPGEVDAPPYAHIGNALTWWRRGRTHAVILRKGQPILVKPVTGARIEGDGTVHVAEDQAAFWNPTWLPRGRLLFYREGEAAPIRADAEPTRYTSRVLDWLTGDFLLWAFSGSYGKKGIANKGAILLVGLVAAGAIAYYFLSQKGVA